MRSMKAVVSAARSVAAKQLVVLAEQVAAKKGIELAAGKAVGLAMEQQLVVSAKTGQSVESAKQVVLVQSVVVAAMKEWSNPRLRSLELVSLANPHELNSIHPTCSCSTRLSSKIPR